MRAFALPPRRARPAVRCAPLRMAARAALVLLLLSPALAACGKKNAPVPPPGAKVTYPGPYPRE